jgi:aspartate kinase
LVVQKYGGTSVGSIERIKAVADRVLRARGAGDSVVVVVSAMAGETNRLFKLASELSESPSARETDVLVATGEQVSRCSRFVCSRWAIGRFPFSHFK